VWMKFGGLGFGGNAGSWLAEVDWQMGHGRRHIQHGIRRFQGTW